VPQGSRSHAAPDRRPRVGVRRARSRRARATARRRARARILGRPSPRLLPAATLRLRVPLPSGGRPMIRAALSLSLALAAAVALSSSPARAENNPDALAPHRLDLPTLDKSYRRALLRRNFGISLAIPGVALNILGTVLFAYGALSGQQLLSKGLQIVSGAIVAVIGLG